MSIVTRKTKSGPVYWVTFRHEKRQVWERVGLNKREAERRDQQRKRELQAGTYDPTAVQKSQSVRQYAKHWLDHRTTKTVGDDRQRVNDHVLSREWFAKLLMDDVRAKHLRQLAGELKSDLHWKTAKNTYGAVRTMFKRASSDEVIAKDPCADLEKLFDDGGAQQKEREPYTPEEAAALVSDERIPEDTRVLNALSIFAGLREGEACGRRWGDIDRGTRPLWCMHVATQYGGGNLKTKRPRRVPVHAELQAVLEKWEAGGFELLTQRKPEPEDFIVPNAGPRAVVEHHTKSSYYKRFRRACELVGVECRSLHSTRHTFITWARRFGADVEDLQAVTHNAKGTIVDGYTHRQWEPLCEAVSKFRVERVDSHQLRTRTERKPGECSGTPAQLDSARCTKHMQTSWRRRESKPGPSGKNTGVFGCRSNVDQTRPCVTEPNRLEREPDLLALASAAFRMGVLVDEVAP